MFSLGIAIKYLIQESHFLRIVICVITAVFIKLTKKMIGKKRISTLNIKELDVNELYSRFRSKNDIYEYFTVKL